MTNIQNLKKYRKFYLRVEFLVVHFPTTSDSKKKFVGEKCQTTSFIFFTSMITLFLLYHCTFKETKISKSVPSRPVF